MSSKFFIQFSSIVKKELRIYFNTPIAYIFVMVLLGLTFWLFFRNFFLVGQVDMRSFFNFLPWTFLFLIPALTMRLWAEESRQGTIENLLTSSVPLPLIVASKFCASLLFLFIALACTLPLPIALSFLGKLDWGATIVSYLGSLLIGAGYISLGLLVSSLTKNQIVAFIISVLISFFLFILAQPVVTYSLPNFLVEIINFISFGAHYESITRGVIDSRDVLYYLSFIALALYFNTYFLYNKR